MSNFQIFRIMLYSAVGLIIASSNATIYCMQNKQHQQRTRSRSLVSNIQKNSLETLQPNAESPASQLPKKSLVQVSESSITCLAHSENKTTCSLQDNQTALPCARLVQINKAKIVEPQVNQLLEIEPQMNQLLEQAQDSLHLYSTYLTKKSEKTIDIQSKPKKKHLKKSSLKNILQIHRKNKVTNEIEGILRDGKIATLDEQIKHEQVLNEIITTMEQIFIYLDDYFTKTTPKAFAQLKNNKEIISIFTYLSFLAENPHTLLLDRTQFWLLLNRLFDKIGFFYLPKQDVSP